MKKIILATALCFSAGTFAESKETFSTTSETAPFGKEQIVTLNASNKFTLSGKAIKVGDYMPSANLMTSDLKPFDTSDKTNSVKIYSVLTSVDTPVCVQQGIDLSNYISKHQSKLKGIEFYAISADTPFAQQRYIKDNSLSSVTYLSDSSKHEFGMNTGSQIEELGLLTRSIIVVDKNNKIVYVQRVPELTTIPDLENAVDRAQKML